MSRFPIQMIVGLGNPGFEYEQTRHNAGVWFIEKLLEQSSASLSFDKKFHGLTAKVTLCGKACHMLVPTTYMNCSGQSVLALATFYKIPPQSILIAHDEIDLLVGSVRLKEGGGHGGHNGLRDIISRLGSRDFFRLRIGVGRPKHKDDVTNYVLGRATKTEQIQIEQAIEQAVKVLPDVLEGNWRQAVQALGARMK